MKKNSIYKWAFMLVLTLLVAACSNGGSGSSGDLSLKLTDAATDEYKAVYVTLSAVEVYVPSDVEGEEGEWRIVAEPGKTYNLLDLVNGVTEKLGVNDLEAGQYSEMRLILGTSQDGELNMLDQPHPYASYIIDKEEAVHELTIPSGYESGIKLAYDFSVNEGETTELILDFNAMKSVVHAGRNGKWMLNPAIKVLNVETVATVSGTVTDTETGEPLAGVLVSVQTDEENGESIVASTLSDEDGEYTVLVEPGDYTLVAATEDHEIIAEEISVEAGAAINEEVVMDAAETGSVEGEVVVEDADEGEIISLSVIQEVATEEAVDAAESTDDMMEAADDTMEAMDDTVEAADDMMEAMDDSMDVAEEATEIADDAEVSDEAVEVDAEADVESADDAGTVSVEVASLNIANGGEFSLDLPVGMYTIMATINGELRKVGTIEITDEFTFMFNLMLKLNADDDAAESEDAVEDVEVDVDADADMEATDDVAVEADADVETDIEVIDDAAESEDAVEDVDVADDAVDSEDAVEDVEAADEVVVDVEVEVEVDAEADADADVEDDAADDGGKVDICHNGKVITVAESAVDAHLAHGDNLGACEDIDDEKDKKD